MESLMEKVLYEGAVEFKSRTYGADASLTEMLWIGPKDGFDARGKEPPGMFGLKPSLDMGHKPIEIRIMKPTEIFTTPLDNVQQDLRLVEKFHPPGKGHKGPSYQEVYGIKGTNLFWQDKKKRF